MDKPALVQVWLITSSGAGPETETWREKGATGATRGPELGNRLWSQPGSLLLLGYQPVDCANPHLGEYYVPLTATGENQHCIVGIAPFPAAGGDLKPPPVEKTKLTWEKSVNKAAAAVLNYCCPHLGHWTRWVRRDWTQPDTTWVSWETKHNPRGAATFGNQGNRINVIPDLTWIPVQDTQSNVQSN